MKGKIDGSNARGSDRRRERERRTRRKRMNRNWRKGEKGSEYTSKDKRKTARTFSDLQRMAKVDPATVLY